MTRIILLAGTAFAALVLVAQTGAMSHPLLKGDVGPGFSIHLKQNGKTVKQLAPGTYSIQVVDNSTIHNFVLKGPGLPQAGKTITGITFKGTSKVKTVTFIKGTYTYVCTPHASIPSMHGSFKVG
jgi:hypothetical protein